MQREPTSAGTSMLRRAQPLNEPLPGTFKWIATLPPRIRPLSLLRQFPRIANELARSNQDPESWSPCVEGLLVDSRGDRQGFSREVRTELQELRDYFAGAPSV